MRFAPMFSDAKTGGNPAPGLGLYNLTFVRLAGRGYSAPPEGL